MERGCIWYWGGGGSEHKTSFSLPPNAFLCACIVVINFTAHCTSNFTTVKTIFLQKMERGCILLKDQPAEKAGTWVASIGKKVTAAVALKGELLTAIPGEKLIPRNDGKRPHNYRLVKDETVTVYAEASDIAPLSENDFLLLLAIKSPLSRFEVFSSDKTEWGLGLKPGDGVYVTIQGSVRASAAIQFIGEITKHSGLLFGVEIMVRTLSFYSTCFTLSLYYILVFGIMLVRLLKLCAEA